MRCLLDPIRAALSLFGQACLAGVSAISAQCGLPLPLLLSGRSDDGLGDNGRPKGIRKKRLQPRQSSPLSLERYLALTFPPKGYCPLWDQIKPCNSSLIGPSTSQITHLPFPCPLFTFMLP